MTKLRFNKSTSDIYSSNVLQKKGWVTIKDGYIYIAEIKTVVIDIAQHTII